MAAVIFALVALVVLALLAAVHRYVWRRLVGDTTAPGSTLRKGGTVAAFVLPLLSVGAMTSGRIGAPFWLQQVLAWPGFLWLAALMYLTLALLVGEFVRPVLRRVLARRDAAAADRTTAVLSPEAVATTTSGTRPRTEELVPAGPTPPPPRPTRPPRPPSPPNRNRSHPLPTPSRPPRPRPPTPPPPTPPPRPSRALPAVSSSPGWSAGPLPPPGSPPSGTGPPTC